MATLSDCLEGCDLRYGTPKYTQALACSLRYITGVYTAFVFQAEIKKVIDFPVTDYKSAKEMRLHIVHSGCLFPIKYFVLNVCTSRGITKREVYTKGLTLGIDTKDMCSVQRILTVNKTIGTDVRRFVKETALTKELVSSTAYKEASSLLEDVYPELIKFIKSLVFRKLTFIVRSTNSEYSDFERDLTLKVVTIYYKLMPTSKGRPYVLNYIKSSLRNHTNNVISSYTADKRARVVSEKDSNGEWRSTLRSVSENQINATNDSGDKMSFEEYAAYSSVEPFIDSVIADISLSQILAKYRRYRKKYKLIRIATGESDTEFTKWLVANKVIKANQDNLDYYYDNRRKDLLIKVSEFLKVDVRVTMSFLVHVCKQLGYTDMEKHHAKPE